MSTWKSCMHFCHFPLSFGSQQELSSGVCRLAANISPCKVDKFANAEIQLCGAFGFHSCEFSKSGRPWSNGRSSRLPVSGATGRTEEYDVVIVGAGIIGLAIANSVLKETNFSVAILDAAQPCAGATGAGQGYIWLGHRQPGTPGWTLASHSKQLWEQLVDELQSSGVHPAEALGWRNTGSLLVASTQEQSEALQKNAAALSNVGVESRYLTVSEVCKEEPFLFLEAEGGALLVPGDSQIDAELAVTLLRRRNRAFGRAGRYQEFFNDPVDGLICSSQDGSIEGVKTLTRRVGVKEKLVIATGAWSSRFMSKVASKYDLPVVPPVKPRKGQLLVLEGFPQIKLKHALMEYEYGSNYRKPAAISSEICSPDPKLSAEQSTYGVAMTMTTTTHGHILLGSSREFKGFDVTPERAVLECMYNRAATFFPALANVSFDEALKTGRVKTGLRPYCSDGRPIIGPVPGLPGVFMATGHEGSGLCMALGTAEIVQKTIRGVEDFSDTPFSPVGRLDKPPIVQ